MEPSFAYFEQKTAKLAPQLQFYETATMFRRNCHETAAIDWLKARIESSLKAGRTVRVPWLAHDLFAEWKLAC